MEQVDYTPRGEYMTLKAAAAALDVTPELLRGLANNGQVIAVRSVSTKGNPTVMVPRSEVERLREAMGR